MDDPTSVYLYYDEHGVLLYVGITARDVRRQGEHNKAKPWWRYVRHQEVEHYDTRVAAAKRERVLIDTFRPPFNVQHNPDHEACRAAFLAYRDSVDGFTSILDFVRQRDKRIPLKVEIAEPGHAILSAPPDFAPVAARLVCRSDRSTVLTQDGQPCGCIERVWVHGPTAFVAIAFGKGVPFGDSAVGRLKFLLGKRGQHRVELWRVQLTKPEEQVA